MKTILDLIRERRKIEYQTLGGYKATNLRLHYLLSEQIELKMKEIGAKNKTILRKEAKGNPYLLSVLKRGETLF